MEESSTHECNNTSVKSQPKQSLSSSSTTIEEASTTMARSQTSVMSEECGISTSDRPMIEQACKVEEIPSRSGSIKDLPTVTIEGSSLPKRIKNEGVKNSLEKTTVVNIQKNEASITLPAAVAKPQQSEIVENKQQDTAISIGSVAQSVPQGSPIKSEPVGLTSNDNSATGSSNQTTTNISKPTREVIPVTATTASSISQSIPATASTIVPAADLKQTPSKPEATVASAPTRQHPIQQTVSTTSQTTSTSAAAASVSQAQFASSGGGSASSTIPAVPLSTPLPHPAAPTATAESTTSTASGTIPAVPLSTPLPHPAAPTATAVSTTSTASSKIPAMPLSTPLPHPAAPTATAVSTTSTAAPAPTTNAAATKAIQLPAAVAVHPPPSLPPPLPLKATTMSHLQKKYTTELQYMLREFRKLERQLLGAKGNGSGIEESSGSRERREKLHSFILHLEDTIRQIDLGCKLESEGKSTVNVGVSKSNAAGNAVGATTTPAVALPSEEELKKKRHLADSAALTKLTKEKEEEENVQKLEEHILANLLPVKVRLTKQLAAQQGASRNPAGMPAARRGMLQPAAEKGKGTFAAAAEQRRKQAEAARVAQQEQSMLATPSSATAASTTQAGAGTQFGKPLGSGGSSLTQKLHGSTLGSKKRAHGHGVGSPSPAVPISAASAAVSTAIEAPTTSETPSSAHKRKILYAGIAPGSEQIQSSVSAAAGVHGDMVMETTPTAALAVAAASVRQSSSETPVAVVKQTPDVAVSSISQQVGTPVATAQAPQPKAISTVKYATARPTKPTVILPPIAKIKASTAVAATTTAAAATCTIVVDNTKKTGKRRLEEMNLTEEERKKLKRRRRRKKKRRDARRMDMERQHQIVIQQQAAQASQGSAAKQSHQTAASVGVAGATAVTTKKSGKGSVSNKSNGKKKGPRAVEYICALCSETYNSTCDYNPWWGLTSHECPKCRKSQIPRIDITAPSNAIEYHPALLAHAEDSSGGNTGGGGAINAGGGMSVMHINPSHMAPNFPINSGLSNGKYPRSGSDSDSGSDLSDDSDGGLSDDSYDSEDSDTELQSMTPAEQAENEKFGLEYAGPKMTDSECSRLLALMCHASTCPGRHKNPKHRDICHSTKFLMLHVRDCPGTTSSLDVCPFPWCRKVKHLLYHLVSCTKPRECMICSPKDVTPNFAALMGLNEHRRKKQRERMKAAVAAASAAKAKSAPPKAATTTMHTAKSRPIHQVKTTTVHALKPPQQIRRPVPPASASAVVAPVVKSEARLETSAHTSTTFAIQQPVATSQTKVAAAVTFTSTPASTALSTAGAAHSSLTPAQAGLIIQAPKASPAAPQALPATIVQPHVKLETPPVSALTNTTTVNMVAANSPTKPQAPAPVVAAIQPKVEAPPPLGTVTCTQTAVSDSTVAQTSQRQQQVAPPVNIVTNVKVESPPVANLAVQAMTSNTEQVTVNSTPTSLVVPAAAPAAASSANIATRAVSDVPTPSAVAAGENPNTTSIANPSATSVSVSAPTVQSLKLSINLQTAHQDLTAAIEANPPLSPARIDSEELPPPVSDSGTLTSHSSPSLSAVQCETKPAAAKPVLVPAVNTTTENETKESALSRATMSSAALIEDSEGCCGQSEAENDADSRCSGHALPNGSTGAQTVKTNSVDQVSTNTGGVLVRGVTSATAGNGQKDGNESFDNRLTTEGQGQNTTSTAQSTDNKISCSEQVVKKEEPVRISC